MVARLRAPDGCPWDRKQTAESFKSYVIEEAHELLEAIDGNDPAHICEELGDLLFQLVFLARLYEEKGLFGMTDAIQAISAKMVRRHPHVFGDLKAGNDEELRRRWQEIKAREKGVRKINHLTSLPRSLPALRRAQRVAERAAKAGGSRQTLTESLCRLGQETKKATEAAQRQEKAVAAMGNLLLAVVEVCRLTGINAEEALQAATDQAISLHLAEEAGGQSPVK
ncbi:MAG: nucleoside triphosphate pyrophosphohydrolase [Deltaproteobacteria bacterium]